MDEKKTNDLFKSMLEQPVDPLLKELGTLMVEHMKVAVKGVFDFREALDTYIFPIVENTDPWPEVEKTLRSVSRDDYQREILGTFVTYDIDQFETVKFASSGNDYSRCDNCKEENYLSLYLCTRRDKTTEHRLYCRKCVRNYHEHQH